MLHDYWLQLLGGTPPKSPPGGAHQFAHENSMAWVVLKPYIGISFSCGCYFDYAVCHGQPNEKHNAQFNESKVITVSIEGNCNHKHCSHEANQQKEWPPME